jgi:aryl-alcohol dehydrogenase-like predicted oxidoreductase
MGDRARMSGRRARPAAVVPLGGGWLSGKYRRDERPTGTTRLGENPNRGVEAYDRRRAHERTWDVLGAVDEIARRRGMSMAQVALAWLVDRPTVYAVILGARTQDQLDDNWAPPACTCPPKSSAIWTK